MNVEMTSENQQRQQHVSSQLNQINKVNNLMFNEQTQKEMNQEPTNINVVKRIRQ